MSAETAARMTSTRNELLALSALIDLSAGQQALALETLANIARRPTFEMSI